MTSVLPPGLDNIVAMADAILKDLPEPFNGLLAEIPIRVQDWPDEQTMSDMEIDDPLELTGLYQGVPIGERSLMNAPAQPEMIFLFRMPILFEWCERNEPLHNIVFDVLTHEIGHHFGMDEEAVMRMEGRLAAGKGKYRD